MNMKRWMLLMPLVPLLAGCLQDTASYAFPEKNHAITLVRNQTWPWQSTLDVTVIALRLPECNGGGDIKDVAEEAAFTLYQAPNEYPEPIFMLKVDQRVFAVSTQSCRVQEFKETPDDLGQKLGAFMVKDDKFQFVAGGA
jgi:hypothetical protein